MCFNTEQPINLALRFCGFIRGNFRGVILAGTGSRVHNKIGRRAMDLYKTYVARLTTLCSIHLIIQMKKKTITSIQIVFYLEFKISSHP